MTCKTLLNLYCKESNITIQYEMNTGKFCNFYNDIEAYIN